MVTKSEAEDHPTDYSSVHPRHEPYEYLFEVKKMWLELKRDDHKQWKREDEARLPSQTDSETKAEAQASIKYHTDVIKECEDELKILNGNDKKAQRELVKKNVEKWRKSLDQEIRTALKNGDNAKANELQGIDHELSKDYDQVKW